MNDSSLLVRLSSYRLRKGRDSLEDFITEAFAWLLQCNPDFATSFLKLVDQKLDRIGPGIGAMTGEGTAWTTQEVHKDCRFDMVARDANTLLVFEHKTDAAATDAQIKKYVKRAIDIAEGRTTHVVMITANHFQWRSEVADACLCWKDVYDLIDGGAATMTGDSTASEPLQDFQRLLAYHGLGPDEPVSVQAVQVYPLARHLKSHLQTLFGHMARMDWSCLRGFAPGRDESGYGRVGLGFHDAKTKNWAPGLLVVTVLDGSDLRIDEQLDTGLKVHVVLCLERCFYSACRGMAGYKTMLDVLRDYADSSDWEFYNQSEQSRSPNKFHPLIMSHSLLDLLRGRGTINDQAESVYAVAKPLLVALDQSGCLQTLRDECAGVAASSKDRAIQR